MTIQSGSRLGPYEIVAPLGAGGMGEVWRGRDTRLDRSVAIKVLPAEFSKDAQFKLRFELEARTISQLNHPHICTLYDVGDNYLVMELLEGESLADRLTKGALPLEQVLRYGTQIADALDKAHRAGIIHRDLKPGNIMITKTGAKLLDFGLAKTGAPVELQGETQHKPLTQEGTILGTFQYMAPEQLEGLEADARTDIFAFGTLLYEMATGKRAFAGKTKTSLIAAIVKENPRPIAELQPLTPPALEHVVNKCLSKDPDDRWQNAHDIAEELRWISEAGSSAGVTAPLIARRKSRERLGWMAAVVVAALAGGIFTARTLHLFQTLPAQYRLTFPTIDSEYRGVGNLTISPDGKTIYFLATNAENKRVIYRRGFDDFKTRTIGEAVVTPFGIAITPDSRNVIFSLAGGVYKKISVDGGAPVDAGVAESGGTAAIASDGTVLVGGGNLDAPVRRMTPNKTEAILTLDKAHGEVGQIWPTFLLERKRLFRWFRHEPPRFLFLSVSREPARGSVHFTLCAGSLGSKEVKQIGEVSSRVEYAAGHIFFVREGTLMAQAFDADKLELQGDALPVLGDVVFDGRSGSANFSVSNDGTIVCQRAISAGHLTWVDQTGKKLGTVGTTFALANGIFGSQRLGVHGDQVIVGINDLHTGISSLWMQGLIHATSTRVTLSTATEVNPVITPDGSRVFFAADVLSRAQDIFEAPLDGSTPPKLVVSAPNAQVPTDVSPDGRFLVYTSNQNSTAAQQDLWILPLTGDRKPYPFLATPKTENSAVFSRDGKWIAYSSNVTGTVQVYVRPFPGSGAARPVSIDLGFSPRFSTDGKRLYFLGGNGKMMAADFHDGAVSEPKVLFELSDRIATYEPVGDRFLMVLINDIDASPPARVIVNWRPPA